MLASDGTASASLKAQELGIKDLASGEPGQCIDSDSMPYKSMEEHRPKEVYLTSKTWTQRARRRDGHRDGWCRLRLVSKSNPSKLRW